MKSEVIKSAYSKANQEPPIDIKDFTREELIALLITCDGVGKETKEKVLNFLLK